MIRYRLLILSVIFAISISSVSACPLDTNGMHLVKLHFLDVSGKGDLVDPIRNQFVIVTPSVDHNNGYLNILNIFGITTDSRANLTPMISKTNEDGIITIPMSTPIKYNISIQNTTHYIYPMESEYFIFVRGAP